MFRVLENHFIIRLKKILQSNLLYVLLTLFLFGYVIFIIIFDKNESIYSINDKEFTMIVDFFKFDGNKLSMTLKSEEDLVANYYIDTYDELLFLKNNIKYGSLLKVEGNLKIPSNNTIPNTFNYRKYLKNKDVYYILNVSKIEILDRDIGFIYKVRNFINDKISLIDSTGYMKAFVLGDMNGIDNESYINYQKIGITHLFAISGSHISLISVILFKLFKKFNDKIKYLLVDIILIIFGFIVGYPAAIKRCIIFFVINSINKLFHLNINSFKVLLLVIFCLILYNYKIIFDVGFLYSVCTVLGIILCNDFISHSNKIVTSFRLSLIAFLFSLPISLCNFYEVNLLSIIYNMFYIPFVSFVVFPLSLLSLIVPILYDLFFISIKILEVSGDIFSNFKIFSIYLNFNMLQVLFFYLITLLVFYRRIYKLGIVLILIVVFDLIVPYFDNNAYVYFFDVGQGDSSLIISPYRGDVILIDTGGSINYVKENWMEKEPYYVSDNVVSFLKSKGIKSIDLLVLSHGDADHMGEAINLVENIKVEKVIFNCGDFNDLEKQLIKVLDKKKIPYYSCIKELNIDDNKLYFLNNKDYGNENDNSSVIYTKLNYHKFLFMGDAGVEVEEDLIEKYNLQNIDVLKVGHHGSKTSSSEEFIGEINPKYSVISVGKNNRYGHPNDSVLEKLEDSKIYRTDEDGSIMFKIDNDKLKIKTCAP